MQDAMRSQKNSKIDLKSYNKIIQAIIFKLIKKNAKSIAKNNNANAEEVVENTEE